MPENREYRSPKKGFHYSNRPVRVDDKGDSECYKDGSSAYGQHQFHENICEERVDPYLIFIHRGGQPVGRT